MSSEDGAAIVYCEGAFATPNGKTAHGLVRFTRRYQVVSVVDSRHAGEDAGQLLDGQQCGIPVLASVTEAIDSSPVSATHLVVGLAPDGGRLSPAARSDVRQALACGLNVDCGLHDFLSEDKDLVEVAAQSGAVIRDVRKPPGRESLHFFSGKIEQVKSFKVAVLGTDSAVGKRTTAWLLVQGLLDAGCSAELIGTGQTAWMQGARYSIILDSLVNDFVSGEIEHVVWSCWKDLNPEVIVLEGQGSLMNPAYPGGFELLAAGRPDVVVLQHAPGRRDYDGFPGYPIQPLPHQIQAIEVISGRSVVAITMNHEGLASSEIESVCRSIEAEIGLPASDVLHSGATSLVRTIIKRKDARSTQ